MPLRIGLTGGIGSGKSTVAQLFIQRHVPVLDADRVAHDLTAQQSIIESIVGYFGPAAVDGQGRLDRCYLRSRVFSDVQAKQWLEALLHPQIAQQMALWVHQVVHAYCVLVVPLLIENSWKQSNRVDRILVVDATESDQIQRIQKRDQISAEQAKAILSHQASRATRLSLADDVICNQGTCHDLDHQVRALHACYQRRKI